MFILGLLLLLIAALLILAALFGGNDASTLDIGFMHFNLTVMVVFFLGMIAMALIGLALSLFRRAAGKAAERRKERKEMGHLKNRLDRYQAENERTEVREHHDESLPPTRE